MCCSVHRYIFSLYFDPIILTLTLSGPDHYFSLKASYLTCFLFKLCDIRRSVLKN